MAVRSVCKSCWSVYGLTPQLTKSPIRPYAQYVDARVTKSLGCTGNMGEDICQITNKHHFGLEVSSTSSWLQWSRGQSFKLKWKTPAEEVVAGASHDRESKRKPDRGLGRRLPLHRNVSCFYTRQYHTGTFWRPNQVKIASPAQMPRNAQRKTPAGDKQQRS